MKRIVTSLALPAALAVSALGGAPATAEAQVSVGVHVSWHWSSDGWRSQPFTRAPRDAYYYAPAPYATPRPAVRIPPGHLPPPGACRLWYVGLPPGHQPPPTSCARLFGAYGYGHPDVLILQGPLPREHAWSGGYRHQDPREFRGPGKGGKGKGPGAKRRGG